MDRYLPWALLWAALIVDGAAGVGAAEGSPGADAEPPVAPAVAPAESPTPDKPAEPPATGSSESSSPPAPKQPAVDKPAVDQPATDVPAPSSPVPDKPAAVAEAPSVESAVKAVPSAEANPTAEAPSPAEAVSAGGSRGGDSQAARSLSVAPQETVGQVTYDRERRPAWVESAPVRFGATHTTAVASGPWLTTVEARQALDAKLLAAAREYAAETVGHAPDAHRLTDTIDLALVKSQLVGPEHLYEETLLGELSGSTYQAHALLQFNATFRNELAARWKAIVIELRLARAAAIGGLILLVVGALYGLLRIDTATRGYYTRSLQFVGGLAILGLVAAGIMLARSIPWL